MSFKDTRDTADQSVWLTVCWEPNHDTDDRWGKEESRVVCRQEGNIGGWPFRYNLTESSRAMDKAIDDVICMGGMNI